MPGYLGNNLNSGGDIVAIAPTGDLNGYWAADDDGTVFSYGDAHDYGSRVSSVNDVRGFASRPQGDGYWLVTKDGVVTAKGAAPYGNTPTVNGDQKIVGMASTPSGDGYWLVGQDGGIFAFGDAAFYGSTGATKLNKPITGMVSHPVRSRLPVRRLRRRRLQLRRRRLLRLHRGRPAGQRHRRPVRHRHGKGYWLVAGNGEVFPFGDAGYYGDTTEAQAEPADRRYRGTPQLMVDISPPRGRLRLPGRGRLRGGRRGRQRRRSRRRRGVGRRHHRPGHGTASVGADQRLTYTPAPTTTAPTRSVHGDRLDGDVHRHRVFTVGPVNDTPSATAGSLATDEDTPCSGTLAGNDVDHDPLTYSVVANAAHGTVVTYAATAAYTYTPDADYNGPDSFTFKANDGTVNSAPATVTISVTAVNDPPTATAGSLTIDEDTPDSDSLAGDDVDQDSLTYSVVTNAAHGTVVVTDAATGAYTYTPDADFNGPDSFTFKANDGTDDSAPATVTVSVTSVNDLPTITTVAGETVDEDHATGALTFTVGDVETLADNLTVTGSSSSTGIVADVDVVIAGSGPGRTVTVTPLADAHGQTTITLTVTDGDAGSTPTTFTVDVTSANDAPTATAGLLTTLEDTPGSGTLAGDDVDNDPLTYSVVTNATHGTVVVTDAATGAYTYTPDLNSNGSDSFTFKADDGTVDSDPVTVTISVTADNDLPTITVVADEIVDEDGVTGALTFTVGDVETDADNLTVTGTSSTGVVIDTGIVVAGTGANRTVTVTPVLDANGQATITLTVTDGDGGSTPTTFTLDVTSINDLPTITWVPLQNIGISGTTGPLTFTVGDVETDAADLVVTASSSSQGIVLNTGVVLDGTGADRTVTVIPLLSATGQTVITLTVTDGDGDTMDTTFEVNVGI